MGIKENEITIGLFFTIFCFVLYWGIHQWIRSKRMIKTIRRENDALNYYLKTEIPSDLRERYINNLNNFRYTNFDHDNIESIFLEIRKVRRDLHKFNDLRISEIRELIDNSSSNNEFDYKQFVYQISQMTNIQYLFDLLKDNKDQELKYVKNVLADIVHTIRNPASGIRVIITLLKMDNVDEQYVEKLDDIVKYIDEIETNLNAYYQISNTQSVVLDNNKVQFKNEVLSRVRLLALSSGKKVNIEYSKMCDVEIDKNISEILMLAITCILENSMSFIKDNGIIDVAIQREESILTIEISNNGPTIQEEFINNIFEQGFSTRASSGRGLAIAKQAVESTLNGIITCENLKENSGVKFTIIIEMGTEDE